MDPKLSDILLVLVCLLYLYVSCLLIQKNKLSYSGNYTMKTHLGILRIKLIKFEHLTYLCKWEFGINRSQLIQRLEQTFNPEFLKCLN